MYRTISLRTNQFFRFTTSKGKKNITTRTICFGKCQVSTLSTVDNCLLSYRFTSFKEQQTNKLQLLSFLIQNLLLTWKTSVDLKHVLLIHSNLNIIINVCQQSRQETLVIYKCHSKSSWNFCQINIFSIMEAKQFLTAMNQ